jgi:hypothetical protein
MFPILEEGLAMMLRIRKRLTYSNVTASLALFVALGTGGAYAAATIGSDDIIDNSVATADLKDGDVRNVDLKPEAIGTTRLKDEGILGADVLNGSLSSDDTDGSVAERLGGTGTLGWYHEEQMQTCCAKTLDLGKVNLKSGDGVFNFCYAPTSGSVTYVRYVNGTRTTGNIGPAPNVSTQDCDSFDPGAAGDFQIYAGAPNDGSILIFGSPLNSGNEFYTVTAFRHG